MHPSLSLSLSDSEFEFEATGWMYHERFSLGVLDQDLTKTVGVSQACYWHEAWFSVRHEWAVYVFFAILTDIDERDSYLAGKLSYCCGNCFWRVFIFASTSPLESFTLKVAFSPSGVVPCLLSTLQFDFGNDISESSQLPQANFMFTVRFRILLTNGFRSSFQIPQVRHKLGNFITQLSIRSGNLNQSCKFRAELRWEVAKFVEREVHAIRSNSCWFGNYYWNESIHSARKSTPKFC